MYKKIQYILSVLYARLLVGILTIYFIGKIFSKLRKCERVFVNYRSFGHSISDTNAFLSSYQKNVLCISIGNNFERNPALPLFYPRGNLIHLILPKPNWIKRVNLRKIAGPFLINCLEFLQKFGLISSSMILQSENKQVVLDCLFQLATSRLELPETTVQNAINYIKTVDSGAREHSKAIGTWAQLYDPEIIGSAMRENSSDKLFLREIQKLGINSEKLVTFILRTGKSPHHGPGLSHYLPIIEFLQYRGYSIIPLGDTIEFETSKELDTTGIIFPQNINVERRTIDFSSVFYSKFTLGDMSGLWPIFTMRGKRGLCLNTIPSKFLMNRVEVLPRRWVNEKGVIMTISQQFGTYGETVRGPNREVEIDGYKPRFHDSKTILECVQRFELETILNKPLEIREPFMQYFAEYSPKMLSNCSIAPEILTTGH